MSYDRINPTYYQTFAQGTPFHAGAEGWTKAPWPTWGDNPNLAGRRMLATDGLGSILAISGLDGLGAANPADENCARLGGKLIPTTSAAGAGADCALPDGTRCEEWALFRGQCGPKGAATASMFPPIPERPAWRQALDALVGAACAYHGFKRNESAGWAVAWAAFGSTAPFLALPIALAQGFGKPKRAAAMAANKRRAGSGPFHVYADDGFESSHRTFEAARRAAKRGAERRDIGYRVIRSSPYGMTGGGHGTEVATFTGRSR